MPSTIKDTELQLRPTFVYIFLITFLMALTGSLIFYYLLMFIVNINGAFSENSMSSTNYLNFEYETILNAISIATLIHLFLAFLLYITLVRSNKIKKYLNTSLQVSLIKAIFIFSLYGIFGALSGNIIAYFINYRLILLIQNGSFSFSLPFFPSGYDNWSVWITFLISSIQLIILPILVLIFFLTKNNVIIYEHSNVTKKLTLTRLALYSLIFTLSLIIMNNIVYYSVLTSHVFPSSFLFAGYNVPVIYYPMFIYEGIYLCLFVIMIIIFYIYIERKGIMNSIITSSNNTIIKSYISKFILAGVFGGIVGIILTFLVGSTTNQPLLISSMIPFQYQFQYQFQNIEELIVWVLYLLILSFNLAVLPVLLVSIILVKRKALNVVNEQSIEK